LCQPRQSFSHIIEAGLATDSVRHQSDRKHAHGARAPPNKDSADEAEKKVDFASLHERLARRCGLLDKREVLTIVGVTYPPIQIRIRIQNRLDISDIFFWLWRRRALQLWSELYTKSTTERCGMPTSEAWRSDQVRLSRP
jgi:hypothetical protein